MKLPKELRRACARRRWLNRRARVVKFLCNCCAVGLFITVCVGLYFLLFYAGVNYAR